MATIQTKAKILTSAVQLFNKKGVADTTLRDISDKTGISIGNLAYHFKNKDAIILELYRQMEEERNTMLSKVQFIPTFENIHEQMLSIMKLSLKYKFFYVSTLYIIRAWPDIAKLHREHIKQHIAYIQAMLDYSVGVGNLMPELHKGTYERLAEVVWSTLHFWMLQEEIRGKKIHQIEAARSIMWELVFPYLTEKGKLKIKPLLAGNSSVNIQTKLKKAI